MVTKSGENLLYEDLTYQTRGACFNVWKEFGGAFKEKMVDRALTEELKSRGLNIEDQKRINIYYNGKKIAFYTPDKTINNSILLEIKCKPILTKEDERQFWYYLKASDYKAGLLINFGSKKLEIKRRVYDRARNPIRVNPRVNPRLSASTQRGFTLVEVLVVLFIIVLISGIIFANYRQGGQQFALQRSANKLAQDIRQAQTMAMGAKECPAGTECVGNVPPGYGIYLSQGNTNYLLYADTTPSGGDENYEGGDTQIETIDLESGVYISLASPSSFSINFKPPDPTVKIQGESGEVNEGIITLSLLSDILQTRTIRVNKAGLIEIE